MGSEMCIRDRPNLGAALEGAEKLFNGSKRSQAKKILIVIMDRKSVSEPSTVEVCDSKENILDYSRRHG